MRIFAENTKRNSKVKFESMKKFYILTMAAIMCGSTATAQNSAQRFSAQKVKTAPISRTVSSDKAVLAKKLLKKNKASQNDQFWLATTEEAYIFDGMDWFLDGTYKLTFNEKGKTTNETVTYADGSVDGTDYTLDANGMVIDEVSYSLDGDLKNNNERTSSKFDNVVKDFKVEQLMFLWDGENWQNNAGSWKRPVVRNSDGNVTNFNVSVPFQGTWDETERTEITYNPETKKAITYKFSTLEYSGVSQSWTTKYDVRDIEWENTNGQILTEWNALLLGENRIRKAVQYYNGKPDGYTLVTYPVPGKEDFEVHETLNDGQTIGIKHILKTTDNFGSNEEIIEEYYLDGDFSTLDVQNKLVTKFNEQGDLLLSEEFLTEEGETRQMAGERYTYTYDEQGRCTQTMIEMYNSDPEVMAYEQFMKIIFSDFQSFSSVDNLAAQNAGLTCSASGNTLKLFMPGMTAYEIYNLTGTLVLAANADADNQIVDLSALATGAYIVKAVGESGVASAKFVNR